MTTSSTDQHQPPPPSSSSSSPSSSITNWDSIIGKNVKTIDYQDAGKVVKITTETEEDMVIISSEGIHNDYYYNVPKNLVQGFEGPNLMLSIVRAELADYEISNIEDYATQLKSIKREKKEDGEEEIIVPLIEEKLNVSKKIMIDEVIIIKEPVIETKTIEVSVMREQVVLEKRPAASEEGITSTFKEPPPRNTRTEIHVPLIHEEVEIKKEPYVKEEIIIRKKPRTKTAIINESVISEKLVDADSSSTLAQSSS